MISNKYFEEQLNDKYGVLMTIENLAEVLDRSKNGLRITLQQDNEMSRLFNQARRKIGRRIYFVTKKVAKILAAKDESENSA